MSRRRRSDIAGVGLSFLDVICCGFGAIVLLLVLTKIGEPMAIERSRVELDAMIRRLQEEIYEIRGETNVLNRQLVSKREQLSTEEERIARLRGRGGGRLRVIVGGSFADAAAGHQQCENDQLERKKGSHGASDRG